MIVKRRWWKTGLALAGVVALGLAGLEGYIRWTAYGYSRAAVERFGGDRAEALIEQVECVSCGLKQRQDAVWALGQMGDGRALKTLRAHLTGKPCDHAKELCQYELEKAIRKIERDTPIRGFLRRKAE
jgi:hypothetical protein